MENSFYKELIKTEVSDSDDSPPWTLSNMKEIQMQYKQC